MSGGKGVGIDAIYSISLDVIYWKWRRSLKVRRAGSETGFGDGKGTHMGELARLTIKPPSALELRTFIEHAPAPIAMFDTEMRYLVVSRRWMDDLLPGIGDVTGRSHYDVFPEVPQRWKDAHAAGLAGETLGAERDPFRRQDGHTQYITWDIRPWRDQAGEIGGILIFCQDVSREVEAAQALGERETIFKLVVEAAPNALLMVCEGGQVEMANHQAEAVFGYAGEDLVGLPVSRLIPDRYGRDHPEWMQRYFDGTETMISSHGRDVTAKAADGAEIPVDVALSAVNTPHGRKVLVSAVDLTARKALEEELRRKSLEAEAASVAKSEFMANMSHELRTPLTGVVGFAHLLQAMDGLAPEVRSLVDRIAHSADALVSVVDNILDFALVEAGEVELEPAPFEPETLIESAVDLVRDRAQDKGLDVFVDAGEMSELSLLADNRRLRQVVLNLVGNAVKFTERGSVTVKASWDRPSSRFKVEVADTGPGVAPEVRPRLFQRFTQGDGSRTRMFGGTGLGLATCKALVALMGGEIGMRDRPCGGSVFWFEIPAPDVGPMAAALAGCAASDVRMKLLLVDDAPMNRELISIMLSPFDVEIVEAACGVDAVEAARIDRFDIILMDLQMPGMDGLTACQMIRAESPLNRQTPIIAVSANVLPDQVKAAHAAGMNDHLGKPIDPARLLSKIAHWTHPGVAD